MKERIGIHFGVAFVYCVITRNLLGNGYLYTTTMTSFQKKSYLLCFDCLIFNHFIRNVECYLRNHCS